MISAMIYLFPVSERVDMALASPGCLGDVMDVDGGKLAAESSDSGDTAPSRSAPAAVPSLAAGILTTLPERLGGAAL